MIARNKDRGFDVSCDLCPDESETVEAIDFRTAVNDIKEKGWVVRKSDDNEWMHIGPDCAALE